MPAKISTGLFVLFLTSGVGVGLIVYIFMRLLKQPFTGMLFRFRKGFKDEDILQSLSTALEQESKEMLGKANANFAYKKLVGLKGGKSYRQKISDLKSVKEINLPANEWQIKLLIDALPAQRDPKLRNEITSYILQIQNVIRKRDIAISAWLTEFFFAGYLFVNSQLDNLNAAQLGIFFLILIAVAFLPIFLIKTAIYKSFFLFFSSCLVLLYIFGYSSIFHNAGTNQLSEVSLDLSLDCPYWIGLDDFGCHQFVLSTENSLTTRIIFEYEQSIFYLKDKECKAPVSPEVDISSTNPFVFTLAPKEDSFLQIVNSTEIFPSIKNLDGTTTKINSLVCSISLEDPIWGYTRRALYGLIGITGPVTILQAILAFINKMNEAKK